MNIKSEKGFTGIDISIAIIVIFIFSTLIALLCYNINSRSEEIELKSKALELAIEEIEKMKNKTISQLNTLNTSYTTEQEIQEGFSREISIIDYHDIKPSADSNIVKKVTVKIKYKFRKQIETIELSTIISKGD